MNDILSQSIVGIVCLCKKVMNIVVIDLSKDVECIVIPQEVHLGVYKYIRDGLGSEKLRRVLISKKSRIEILV